jgi:transposase InsO family protein
MLYCGLLGISDRLDTNKVKELRSNHGGKYISNQFTEYCLNNGIKRELIISHTPEQNGVAERVWWTLFNSTRAFLKEFKLNDKCGTKPLKQLLIFEIEILPVLWVIKSRHMKLF